MAVKPNQCGSARGRCVPSDQSLGMHCALRNRFGCAWSGHDPDREVLLEAMTHG